MCNIYSLSHVIYVYYSITNKDHKKIKMLSMQIKVMILDTKEKVERKIICFMLNFIAQLSPITKIINFK